MMKNPWKTLSTREIYRNAWIRLREDRVITPGGSPGIYGVVETKPAIGIVPLSEDLQTWLVGQFRYTLNVYSWEIPEGGGLEGEPVEQGARRELEEETGLRANNWTGLGTCYTSNSFTDEVAYLFLARDLQEGDPAPDITEQLTIRKVPFQQAWDMVQSGEIKDAMSVIALLRTRMYLLENKEISNK